MNLFEEVHRHTGVNLLCWRYTNGIEKVVRRGISVAVNHPDSARSSPDLFDSKKEIVRLFGKYEDVVDAHWYLNEYEDVRDSDINPVVHFIVSGEKEGRSPSRFVNTSYIAHQIRDESKVRPIEYLLNATNIQSIRPLPNVRLDYLSEKYNLITVRQILKFLNQSGANVQTTDWFNPGAFEGLTLQTVNPHHYFLNNIHTSPKFSNEFHVLNVKDFKDNYLHDYDAHDIFDWNGDSWVIVKSRLSKNVIDQIKEQFAFDPTPSFSNVSSLPFLRNFSAVDLDRRDLIDSADLYKHLEIDAHTVFVLDSLRIGGAEKYCLQLANELACLTQKRIELLVTNQNYWPARHFLDQYGEHALLHVYSFFDSVERSWKKDFLLAQYLNAKKATNIIFCNSETGFQTIKHHGRSLAETKSLFSLIFSESPVALGVSYSSRFLLDAVTAGTVVTDNQNYVNQVLPRLPSHFASKMKVLPAMVASGITNTSSKKLRGVRRAANLPATLVWFGRLEILKDLHSLISFCHLRPEVLVVAYGPIEFTSDVQLPKNLQLRGTVNSIENIDLDEFDAFLFTSKFEGMPNVVLEMAEREIPIIAASVGGIVETFGTESIFLYSNADDSSETARRISLTLNDLQSLNDSQIADRVKRAREILMIKHSHSHYKDRVVEIFLKSGAE